MIIKKFELADYENVYRLWMSCEGMGLNSVDDSKEGIEKFLRRNPETSFLAEEDGAVIGAIMAGNDGRRGYIYHTAVEPHCRGKGVGTALVNAVMDAFAEIGITKVALVVFDRNLNGNAFWEKMGFTVREDLVYRNKPLADSVRIDT